MSKVWIEKEKKYGYILRVEGLRLVELWNTERITLCEIKEFYSSQKIWAKTSLVKNEWVSSIISKMVGEKWL